MAFESYVSLVAGDTHGHVDVFVSSDCSVSSAAVCGDGARAPGCEQCDDGNTVSGDGCSTTCQSELIPGGGVARTDCTQEWLANPVPARDRKSIPKNQLQCTDDVPGCDFGTATGDKACTFQVALCFNAAEQRFNCTPTDVTRVQLQRPKEVKPKDAIDQGNRDALEAALTGIGGVVRGACSNSGPHHGEFCTANSDCDSTPGSGKGVCTGRFVAFQPSLTTTNACTAYASITVPLRQTTTGFSAGYETLSLKATRSDTKSDSDTLTLVCKPSP